MVSDVREVRDDKIKMLSDVIGVSDVIVDDVIYLSTFRVHIAKFKHSSYNRRDAYRV